MCWGIDAYVLCIIVIINFGQDASHGEYKLYKLLLFSIF